MGILQKFNEERKSYKREGKTDLTERYDISNLGSQATLNDIKKKATEIADKNTELVKYHRILYRQKLELKEKYDEYRRSVELEEIKNNKSKKRTEQLTKDQLNVLIESKIPSEIIKAIKDTENEITISELISKNHLMVSEQLKNYNMSDTTQRRYVHNERAL